MIQTLFPNNDAGLQEDNAPIHTPETVNHGLKSMKVKNREEQYSTSNISK
jgi:hypothetical protein